MILNIYAAYISYVMYVVYLTACMSFTATTFMFLFPILHPLRGGVAAHSLFFLITVMGDYTVVFI